MLMISYILTELVKVVYAEVDHLIYSEKINILEMFANSFMEKLGIDNSDIDVVFNIKIFMLSLMRDARLQQFPKILIYISAVIKPTKQIALCNSL